MDRVQKVTCVSVGCDWLILIHFVQRKRINVYENKQIMLPGYLLLSTSTPPDIDSPNILSPDLTFEPKIF